MPRYECSEGTSNKFWEIELSGKSFTVCYGAIGSNGRSTVRTLANEVAARKLYDRLIAEKTSKGYRLIGENVAEVDPRSGFSYWCEAIEQTIHRARQIGDPAFDADVPYPFPPGNDVEVARMIRLVSAALGLWSQPGTASPELALDLVQQLLETLRSADRKVVRSQAPALVGLLAPYANDQADDVLRTLAWLDTESSVLPMIDVIVTCFSMREITGFGRIVDEVPRDTVHVALLFPALAKPVEKQQALELMWDDCHLEALLGIVKLANDLTARGSLTESPFRRCRDELRAILAEDKRVDGSVSNALRAQIEKALASI